LALAIQRSRIAVSPNGSYDAFGLIGTTVRELGRKTLIFFERVVS
jgi:hypothetical protein